MAAISQPVYKRPAIGREEISPETVALPAGASLPSDVPPVYLASLFYFYCLRVSTLYAYTCTCTRGLPACRRAAPCCGALTALSVREVFLSLDFPPGIITLRSAQIRDYSPDCRGDRTKSARACGMSAEEIFLTARCHRVRPTEITDEDSEKSSTPVTVQERAGGRSPPPTIVSD